MNNTAWTLEEHLDLYPRNFNKGLAEHIYKKYKPNAILEFGCGVGWYCNFYNKMDVSIVHGIEPNLMDPTNFDEEKNCKQFCFDITTQEIPQEIVNTKYDLILTIEVMEHIAKKYHPLVFDFFKKKNPKWICFSAARPGQKGKGHIACRTKEDWRSELVKRNFKYMPDHTEELVQASNPENINHIKNFQVFYNLDYKE